METDVASFFKNIKEVIQPHLPVRLPCYDLAPLADFWLELVKTKPHQRSTRMA